MPKPLFFVLSTLVLPVGLLLSSCGSSGDGDPLDDILPSNPPTLNHENYISVVRSALGWYSGYNYSSAAIDAWEFYQANDPVYSELVSTGPIQWHYDYACANPDGTASIDLRFPELSDVTREITIDFAQCEWDFTLYEGHLDYRVAVLGEENLDFADLMISDTHGSLTTMNGHARKAFSGCGYGDYKEWAVQMGSYLVESSDISIELKNINTRFGYGAFCAQEQAILEGSMVLRSSDTGGKALSINTLEAFENTGSADRHFPVGILQVSAEDNSQIKINADNGDINSVTVSITIDDVTDMFTEPWSTWDDALVLDIER